MPRQVVLLRGINLVKRNRIAMPELRSALEGNGYRDVRTYVQSGNIVLSSRASPERVAKDVKAVIKARFALDITILVRSREELAAVVQRNPLARVATNPRRYLVTFLSAELPPGFADKLSSVAQQEPFAAVGAARREEHGHRRDLKKLDDRDHIARDGGGSNRPVKSTGSAGRLAELVDAHV